MISNLPCDIVDIVTFYLTDLKDISSLRCVLRFNWTRRMIYRASKQKISLLEPPQNAKCALCKRSRLTMIIFKQTCISWIPFCEEHAPVNLLDKWELFCYS